MNIFHVNLDTIAPLLYLLFLVFFLVSCSETSIKKNNAIPTSRIIEFDSKISPSDFKENVILADIPWHENTEAVDFFNGRLSLLENLSKPNYDPYSGTDTRSFLCGKDKIPSAIIIENDAEYSASASLFSSKNRVLGQCGEREQTLKVQYLLLHCKLWKREFVVKYFYNSDIKWILSPIAKCKEREGK